MRNNVIRFPGTSRTLGHVSETDRPRRPFEQVFEQVSETAPLHGAFVLGAQELARRIEARQYHAARELADALMKMLTPYRPKR